jgi:phosphoribosylamine--glycine ligase
MAPYVIEYNCRLGDPETEVMLPRMQTDLLSCFVALGEGRLREVEAVTDPRAAATIVLVSGGYPVTLSGARRSVCRHKSQKAA